MTPLPPNPTPTEVHVRLLTLMEFGAIQQGNNCDTEHITYCEPPDWFWKLLPKHIQRVRKGYGIQLPDLDDNLLRLCRERLLTTEDTWRRYFGFIYDMNSDTYADHFNRMLRCIKSSVLTHSIAICRAVETNP